MILYALQFDFDPNHNKQMLPVLLVYHCFCFPSILIWLLFISWYADSPSGTVLSMTVKLAEKPSLAMALSVLIVSARMPV